MKNANRKIFVWVLSTVIILFLIYYAINIYSNYRIQKLPTLQVVLEVDIPNFLEKYAKDKDETYYTIMEELNVELKTDKNQDVFNLFQKKFAEKQIPLNKYYSKVDQNDNDIIIQLKNLVVGALERNVEVIRDRLYQYGIYEPLIQKQYNWQIIVKFPLEPSLKYKKEEVTKLINGNAFLEFKIVKDPEFTIDVMQKIDNVLSEITKRNKVSSGSTEKENKEMSEEEFREEHPFFAVAMINPESHFADAYVKETDRNKIQIMLNGVEVQKVIPKNAEFIFSAIPITQQERENIYVLFFVNKNPELTGDAIKNAKASIDPNTSAPVINMEMNTEGAREWAKITESNIGERIAIIMDGIVYVAPVVNSKITSGRAQLIGMENIEEAKLIEIVLKAGALPAPLNILSEEIIEAH